MDYILFWRRRRKPRGGAVVTFTPIQILIPAFGYVNEVSPSRQFLIPNFGFINSAGKV